MISHPHVFPRLTDYKADYCLTADMGTSFQQTYVAVAALDRQLCDKIDKQLQSTGVSKHKRKREIPQLWKVRQEYLLAESTLDKSVINTYYEFNYANQASIPGNHRCH